jgi:hypothetical protein
MRAAFGQPKMLQAETHLLDGNPSIAVRCTRPGLARAAVPLFYRRDVMHKACQRRLAQAGIFYLSSNCLTDRDLRACGGSLVAMASRMAAVIACKTFRVWL